MLKSKLAFIPALAIAAVSFSSLSWAADAKPTPKATPHGHEMTKEQRQQMAEMHQKMADCLKSDKPLSECRSEMMKACHDKMGAEGCPMMGHHGEGHGHKHGASHEEHED